MIPGFMADPMLFRFKQITRDVSGLLLFSCLVISPLTVVGQSEDEAVIRGKIAYDKSRIKSWDGNRLVVPYGDIVAKLREKVKLPDPPLPQGFSEWKRAEKLDWLKKFLKTNAGKKYVEKKTELIEAARTFDINFEEDGTFVIYDVPVGTYGIQGRVDKEIGGTDYGFEVFGEIQILKDVDELQLEPIRVEVTPLMKRKQPAPPVSVKTHDEKATLNLETFEGNYLFLNFWTAASPTAAREQKMIQEMYLALKTKFPVKLLSINVDEDRKTALHYIVSNRIREGSHGFTNGIEHRTIFDYGVRSFPSFWLINKDKTILMTQYEIAQAMRVKPDMITIVSDRLDDNDGPEPAQSEVGTESDPKQAEATDVEGR